MPTVLTSRKSKPDQRAALRHLALTDLFALARYILYKDSATPMTKEFHRAVCSWRARSPHKRNLYLLSRDHLKTSLLTISANVQRILKDPTVRILLASDKADAAEGMLAEIKGHLANPLLVWLFPEVLWEDPYRDATEWSQSALSVQRPRETKEATIETIGVEGASTGRHYDHGTFDDLVDETNSRTRDLLEKTIHWYSTSQSLFEPNATQDIIGTPWEFGDLYDWAIQQRIAGNLKLGIFRQPCWQVREPGTLRLDERGGIAEDEYLKDAGGQLIPAFAEKHSRDSLDERRRINPRLFAAQWLLRPVDDSSALFPRSKAVIKPRVDLPDPADLWCVSAVDPAISTKAWADYSAIATVGFAPDGMAYVLDLRRGRWAESQLIDEVFAAYRRIPGIRIIGFEAVGFQKLYLREFQRASESRGVYLPLMKLERDTKMGKSVRIRSLEPFWQSQQIVFASDLPALTDFLEEAERFRPWKESTHDDLLDALADCLQMRVRPEMADSDAGLDDEEREERQFEREIQSQRPPGEPLDRSSLRAARLLHRKIRAMEHGRENALAQTEIGEFYS
jgi:predicted phage terminase large subunit-like protein